MDESPIHGILKLAGRIFDIFLQRVTDADPALISPAAARIHTTHSGFFSSFSLVSPCGCEGSWQPLSPAEKMPMRRDRDRKTLVCSLFKVDAASILLHRRLPQTSRVGRQSAVTPSHSQFDLNTHVWLLLLESWRGFAAGFEFWWDWFPVASVVTPSQEPPDLTAELKTKDWDRSARHSEINESQLLSALSTIPQGR